MTHFRQHSIHLLATGLLLALSACRPSSQEPRPPGRPDVHASVTQGVAGEALHFGCVALDPQSQKLSYTFDFGDGASAGWTPPRASGSTVEREHSFAAPGTYAVRCRARNESLTGDWSAPVSITITHRPEPTLRYTLSVGVEGQGTVRSSPEGLDCGTACGAEYEEGTPLTLTATPAEGWLLEGWTGSCSGTEPQVSLVLSAEATCTARFVPVPTVSFEQAWRRVGTSGPRSTVWSPDGTRIAAALGDSSTVALWEASTGELLRVLDPHPSGVFSVTWSPDGTQLATGGGDGLIRFWNATTGAQVEASTEPGEPIRSLVWNPDGVRLGFVQGTSSWRIWNRSTGTQVGGVEAKLDRVQWNPEGTRLALENWGATEWEPGFVYFRDAEGVSSGLLDGQGFAWSPLGDKLAIGVHAGKYQFFQAAELSFLSQSYSTLSILTQARLLSWSADARYIAAGDGDKLVIAETGTDERVGGPSSLPGVQELAFHPSQNSLLVTQPATGTLSVLAAPTLSEERTLTRVQLRPLEVAWSPDGKTLATASEDGRLWLWSAEGQLLRTLSGSVKVTSLSWHPQSTSLAVGAEDGTVRRWNALDGTEAYPVWELGEPVGRVAWSPDGLNVAAGGTSGRLAVWTPADGGLATFVPAAHSGAIRALAWSPDSVYLLLGGEDRVATLRNAHSGGLEWTSPLEVETVGAVAWSPDGKVLATAGASGTPEWNVRLLDASTREELGSLSGRASSLTSLDWSRDGLLLAGSRQDGSVEVWNVASRSLLDSFAGAHPGGALGVSWAPNGEALSSCGADTALVTWRVIR